jgi:hypothetical protein
MGVIYMIKFANGKKYIGQTKYTFNKRVKEHISSAKSNSGCPLLGMALRKAMRNHQSIRGGAIYECADEDLNVWETFFISMHKSDKCDFGYNLTGGGTYKYGVGEKEELNKPSPQASRHGFELPKGVRELHEDDKNRHGFAYIDSTGKHHAFTSMYKSMLEKYAEVIECYECLTEGLPWEHKNMFKRGTDSLKLPMYIVNAGEKGFAINIGPKAFPDVFPNGYRKRFGRDSRIVNLDSAKQHLAQILPK